MTIQPALQNQKDGGTGVGLRPGENLVRVARIHWGIYWKGFAVLALSLVLMLKVFNLGAFFMIVAAITLGLAYLTKHYMLLMLTDKRMVVRHGILNLETVQMHFNRIESVEVFRPPIGRLLGYATVVITGTGSRVTGVPFIADADAFRSDIDRLMFEREEKELAK